MVTKLYQSTNIFPQMKSILHTILFLMSIPVSAQLQAVGPGVYHWSDFPVKAEEGRETRSVLEGTSPHFEYLEIHATTQMAGAKPRPAHANKDIEELLIIKEGKLKMTVGTQSAILGAGSVVLLLPQEMHTLENVGDGPVTYYVMRYRAKKPMDLERGKSNGGVMLLNQDSLEFKPSARGGGRAYMDRPTAMCENMEMHVTRLDKKGPSHTPHTHVDTEIILVIEGNTQVAIDGKTYTGGPGDIFFINSNLLHGVSNAADVPCMYFAYKWR